MTYVCPDCRGKLVVIDPHRARCSVHGGEFQVLFERSPAVEAPRADLPSTPPLIQAVVTPAVPTSVPAPAARGGPAYEDVFGEPPVLPPRSGPTACASHPDRLATGTCAGCKRPLCDSCSITSESGAKQCVTCATQERTITPPVAATSGPTNVMCSGHPDNPAIHWCQLCATPICATCDFTFPGDVHLCPACATKPQGKITPRRRKLLRWSFALGSLALSALVLDLVISAAAAGRTAAINSIDLLLTNVSLWSAVVGTALGISARDKRLVNPGSVMAAILLNGVVLGILFLLIIVGLTAS